MKIEIKNAIDKLGKYLSCGKKTVYVDDTIFIRNKVEKPKIKIKNGKLTRKYSNYIRNLENEINRYSVIEILLKDLIKENK